MSTICRTCLQKSNKTFKINQTITDFGGGEDKILLSFALRFYMPELYLGLSSNPEICYECKESLTVAYLFKKKCLRTENVIGNFLKNTRRTGKTVDLNDVLGYFDEQLRRKLEVEKGKQNITPNAQDIISEWDEASDEPINIEKIIQEVSKSAPNPANQQENSNKLKFCHETGLFFDQQGRYYDCSGYLVDINKIRRDEAKIRREEVAIHKEDPAQITKNHPDFIQEAQNFCKITSVFSLSAESTDKDPVSIENSINNASNLKEINNTNVNLIDIKEEPLEVEINGERVDFNYYPTDEDTLDASETGSYDDMNCTSRLQGIIDNLPEISDTNQYVDVPEFVHINNFGLKELEELKRQQQNDGKVETKKIVLNFKNKLPATPSSRPSDSGEKDTKSNADKEEKKEAFTKVPLSTLPEKLVINGKIMVKCAEGYRLMEDPGSKPIQILSRVRPVSKRTNSATQVDIVPVPKPGKSVIKKRKKIKIVPVNDKFKLCSQKGAKLDLKISKQAPKIKKLQFLPQADDKDVVVLFTNYNYEGEYINDHDYLVNPYKRNKVLIEEEGQWFCMCYICHTKHYIYDHVSHMQKHESKCKICRIDLGTPYMLNVHVRGHTKPCRFCTERIPYGLKDRHEEVHIRDLEFENKKKKRGRKRKTSVEDVGVQPAKQSPLPVKKKVELEPVVVKEEIEQPEEFADSLSEEATAEESSEEEEWKKTGSSSKKPKKRRRLTKSGAESVVVERSSRVLRSNVRKSYSETECDDIIANNLKLMSSTL